MEPTFILLLFVLVLSIFLGFELISKVPSTLHTPLMSGANAISGITIVGAILTSRTESVNVEITFILGMLAVFFATVNVVGGYLVTNRMLSMFKKKQMEFLNTIFSSTANEAVVNLIYIFWFVLDYRTHIIINYQDLLPLQYHYQD